MAKNYLEYTDEQLFEEFREVFNDFSDEMIESRKEPYKSNLIMLQNEIQYRTLLKNTLATNELIGQQKSSQEQARKWSKWTIRLSICTIILAATTIIFAFVDFNSDKYWMKDQKELLMKIDKSINDLDKPFYLVLEADSTVSNIIKH